MSKVHGIVYAYHSSPRLGDLTRYRTNASLPFCGRYRLIDFALSSLSNAGVHSVGVIMQRDYQSLLDPLGSGKAWDLSRRSGGLHLLPPVGVTTRGDYQTGVAGLPKTNVLEFQTDCAKVLVRPSGTEPKVKVYLSARAANMDDAENMNQRILAELTEHYLK